MAVAAVNGHGRVVWPEVAGITVGHLYVQILISMTVDAYGHGAELLARQGVKPVADATVTITAMDATGYTLLDGLDEQAMRNAQAVAGDLARHILVAYQTRLGLLCGHVGHDALVCALLSLRLAVAPMAGNAA
jgi:hypothetical protein